MHNLCNSWHCVTRTPTGTAVTATTCMYSCREHTSTPYATVALHNVVPGNVTVATRSSDSSAPHDRNHFARASMSIPLFVKPFRLPYFTEVPSQDNKKRKVQVGRLLDASVRSKDWQERNGYTGVVPEQAVFCDGGMLSNFPIRLFHEDWVEDGRLLLPTIGVQLGSAMLKIEAVDVSGAGGLLGSVLDTARRNMDRTFVTENQAYAYKETLAVIDCDKFDWLEFDIGPAKRQELRRVGMVAAAKFLMKWVVSRDDVSSGLWSTYKEKRRLLYLKPEDGD